MTTTESLSQNNLAEVHSDQPVAIDQVERNDLAAFFMVGVVINIVLVVAYCVWAYKQWNNKTTENKTVD
jgi:heme/copper-type cytochrome/quinol oxidase subunit 2